MRLKIQSIIVFIILALTLLSPGSSLPQKTGKTVPRSGEAAHSACPLSPKGKGKQLGVCKHCGCRMQYSDEDMEKMCHACKCGKKEKECVYHH